MEDEFYSEEKLTEMLDDDVISMQEYAFMIGYLRGDNYAV